MIKLTLPIFGILCFITSLFSEVEQRTANNGNLVMEGIPEIPQEIVDSLSRYQNTRSAPFRGWTLDGDSIYVSTRFGDVSQIHKVDTPMGARQQLTFFKEPIGSVSVRPEHEAFAFTMDAGGSEFAQIFLFDPATGESKMLTDGESRNGVISWSKDGKQLAFQSTQRNGKSNDVWIMDPENPEFAKMVWESTDGSWWGPAGWNEDGTKMLIQRYISASHSQIYLLDLASGDKQLVAGSEETASSNFSAGFSKGDKGFFLITDQEGSFKQLAYQAFDGEMQLITGDIAWDVEGFSMNEEKDRAAFQVNEDGMSVVYLLDPETFNYKKIKGLPIGLAGGLDFSPDSKQLGLTLNTAQSPSDSFVLELKKNPLKHGDLIRWTKSEVGGLDTDRFSLPELIRYKSFDGLEVPAFVYKPKTKGPHPVIISIHGGPESQFQPAFRSTYQLWIDQLGATVICPNVRGSSGYGKEYLAMDNGYKREDSVKDIGALLDWIAKQPDLDKDRVAVFGGSYGGYMVLASAAHYSDRLKAAVDIVGISNFVTFLENTQDYRRDLRRVEYGDERDPEMRKFLEDISPLNHVEKMKIPMFVVQGENDPRVPVTEAVQVVESLRKNGNAVWYMNALNEGHGYRKKENRDIYTQATVLFFKENL